MERWWMWRRDGGCGEEMMNITREMVDMLERYWMCGTKGEMLPMLERSERMEPVTLEYLTYILSGRFVNTTRF